MKKLKKILIFMLMLFIFINIVPLRANAAWKLDSKGWWYTEGQDYTKNQWKYIDGKWYYFNYEGYMTENLWMYEGYYLNSNGQWSDTAKYLRYDILKNGLAICQKGDILYESGDPSPLKVINGEPCIITEDKNEEARYIGLNTLNVYSIDGVEIDKVVIKK